MVLHPNDLNPFLSNFKKKSYNKRKVQASSLFSQSLQMHVLTCWNSATVLVLVKTACKTKRCKVILSACNLATQC